MNKIFGKLKSLVSSEYHRNILTLISGSLIGQTIPVLFTPILAWIYSPAEFGVMAVFVSLVLIISVFVCGRYELAIILPEEDETAAQVALLTFFVTIAMTLLSILLLIGLQPVLLNYSRGFGSIYAIRMLLPVAIFVIGVYQTSYYWLNRLKAYRKLAKMRVIQALIWVVVSFILGILHLTNYGLVLGYLLAQICATLYIYLQMHADFKRKKVKFTLQQIKLLAKTYKNFPLFMSGSAILERVAGQLPVFLLGHFYGADIVGYYALAQRVIQVPVVFIARSVSDVFRQKASEDFRRNGHCVPVFMSTFKRLSVLAIPPFLILILFAPYLFNLIFTSKWSLSGVFTQMMSVILLFQFVVSPLSSMFIVAEKQKFDLFIQIYLFIAMVLSIGAGYYFFHSAVISVLLFVIVYALKYTLEGYLSYRFSLGGAIESVRE